MRERARARGASVDGSWRARREDERGVGRRDAGPARLPVWPARRRDYAPEAALDAALVTIAVIALAALAAWRVPIALVLIAVVLAWAIRQREAFRRRLRGVLPTEGDLGRRRDHLEAVAAKGREAPEDAATAVALLADLELLEGDPDRGRALLEGLAARGWTASCLSHPLASVRMRRWVAILDALDGPIDPVREPDDLLPQVILAVRRGEHAAVGARIRASSLRRLAPAERRALHVLWAYAAIAAPPYRGEPFSPRAILDAAGPIDPRELRWLTDRMPAVGERVGAVCPTFEPLSESALRA